MSTSSTSRALSGNDPIFTLTTADGRELQVLRFTATEGLSSLFEVNIELAGLEDKLSDIIDTPLTLTIEGIETPRYISGICASFDYIGQTREFQLYEATIVPSLWRLQLRRNNRIFQDLSTPEIVKQVLIGAGLASDAFRFDLSESYAPRNYCVQYCEDDFSFLCRLLEKDGIFYFFEHDKDTHTVVFADHSRAHHAIPGDPKLWFRPLGGDLSEREDIHSFRFGERIRPGAVVLRDYNLHRPSEPMEVTKLAKHHTDLEAYTYPGAYQDPGRGGSHQGQTLAKLRLEAHQATRRAGSGTSDSPRLTPGYTLTLTGHPRAELDSEYRILTVEHVGHQPQVLGHDASDAFSYTNKFTVSELSVPFRPQQTTPRSVMRGLQTATVVGPAGEEVHTDEHGRVKVQFHWDRSEPFDDTSSCWVRVSQLWAGNGWGTMFIPRIGNEVLVDFIEGDPDRPVITGRVYTGENRPPYPLPDEKTKTTIKSDSSCGGGGFNELRFEDNKGSEQLFLHAQKDFDEVVLNNHTEDVGANETNKIGSNQDTTVGGNRTMHVVGDFNETIDGTETRKVTGAVDETFSASETRNISADQSETIGGSVTRTITGSVTETVSGALSQTITGGVTVTTPATFDVTAAAGMTMTSTGPIKFIAQAGFTVLAPGGTKTIDQDFWKFGGGQGDAFSWQIGISAIKLDLVGIAIAHSNIKLEHVGMAIEVKTASFSRDGAEIKSVGAALQQGYASLHTFGLLSIL